MQMNMFVKSDALLTDFIYLMMYECILGSVCYVGDNLLSIHSNFLRAVSDSLTHGFVGFFSWAVVVGAKTRMDLLQCFLAFFLAAVVDVDHFLAAKSLKLQDALSLTTRPFFHASTIIPVMTMVFLTASVLTHEYKLQVFSLLFFVAWTSHHIRDAHRRGLWFPPFGETPPLKKTLYLFIILLTPIVTRFLLSFCISRNRYRQVVIGKNSILDV